ncbi:MAG: hypothetical protein WCG04_00695 [Alphaproteobacteria bacterium]
MLYTSQVNKMDANAICVSMAFIAAGGAMMAGTFGVKALSIFPEIKGTALAMMTAIRQLFACLLVILSELLFDGTIVPVAIIIFGCASIATACYAILTLKSSPNPLQNIKSDSG